MVSAIKWIEKHQITLTRASALCLIFFILLSLCQLLQLTGLPQGMPSHWSQSQWQVFNFFWRDDLIGYSFLFIAAVLLWFRILFIFPILLLYLISVVPSVLLSAQTLLHTPKTFWYWLPQVTNMVFILLFILTILGTTFWLRSLKRS